MMAVAHHIHIIITAYSRKRSCLLVVFTQQSQTDLVVVVGIPSIPSSPTTMLPSHLMDPTKKNN
jgi:hypothetical protein